VTTADRAPTAVAGRYEAVVGIEVHARLRTVSKMFCACPNDSDGLPPNTNVCPVCLGLPGALPVINRRAVELVLATGAAIDGSTPRVTRWDRKNYFYPDLPKGYQISQYDLPLASAGRLAFETSAGPMTVRIQRAHLEEDTAKLVHGSLPDGRAASFVDFNRSGVPLMEIVTEPDIRTGEQARRYAEELQLLLRAIGASEADMDRGQMRVEANVSVRPRGRTELGTRVEVKNMNSFRSVERAIAYEVVRQAAAIDAGEPVIQETRGWDEDRGRTYHQRLKEESEDYRYFPDPDLPPLRVDPDWLGAIVASLPELPADRRRRYTTACALGADDAATLVSAPRAADLFEAALAADGSLEPKTVANWVLGEYLRSLKADPGATADPAELARLVRLVTDGEISGTNAKEVFAEHLASGRPTDAIVAARGLRQISDADALAAVIGEVVAANPAAVADYRAGKAQAMGFLVGQVMKATRGQANAGVVQATLRRRLERGGE
jgi:aspartyl-tRNA(Asn)/glutamyl-tRNA(Gln) amidotransferase subunit B